MNKNAIPQPAGAYPQMLAWAQRTYAPGTPVKFSGGGYNWLVGRQREWPATPGSGVASVLVPDETRGTVVAVVGNDADRLVVVQVAVNDARRYASVAQTTDPQSWMIDDMNNMWSDLDDAGTNVVSRGVSLNALQMLVPLVDNWAAIARPMKRLSLPTSQKRTSRRVRPNVIAPSSRRKPPRLQRGNEYVYFPFAEAPLRDSEEFRAALKDPRSHVRYSRQEEAVRATHELDREYPGLRWHTTDAQRPKRGQPRPNPYYHATRGDLARKILDERKLRAFPSRKYEGRPAVFAGDTRDPSMADQAMSWADTKHTYHFMEHPEEENVLIEFDARPPDDRRGRSGRPDPSGDEAVWFEDVDLVNPRIVKRRRGEVRLNPAPPPPREWAYLPQWIKKTFPDGTAARLREDRPAFSPSKYGHVLLPAGTKGRVVFTGNNVDENGHEHWYLNEVELVFAPYPSYSIPDDAWLHLAWPEVWEVLEPLDDHWGAPPRPMKRLSLPSSQKRTSRRLRPNERRTSRRKGRI